MKKTIDRKCFYCSEGVTKEDAVYAWLKNAEYVFHRKCMDPFFTKWPQYKDTLILSKESNLPDGIWYLKPHGQTRPGKEDITQIGCSHCHYEELHTGKWEDWACPACAKK